MELSSNEGVLKFLELYQSEPVIWDPKHKCHKDKQKVNDAWERISKMINCPINILKKKKETLMATFRGHLRRKRASIRSGAGTSEIYTPIWFAYALMESFLLPVYTANESINTDEIQIDDTSFEQQESVDEDPMPGTSTDIATSVQKPRIKKRSIQEDLHSAEQQMKVALNNLSETLQKKPDECELYGQLLAQKLRKLSDNERIELMYEIDGLVVRSVRNSIQFNKNTNAEVEIKEYFDVTSDHTYS